MKENIWFLIFDFYYPWKYVFYYLLFIIYYLFLYPQSEPNSSLHDSDTDFAELTCSLSVFCRGFRSDTTSVNQREAHLHHTARGADEGR